MCIRDRLISFRYGTVPIVRETGGLKDTVKPYNEYENSGDGFSFSNYNADAVSYTHLDVYKRQSFLSWTIGFMSYCMRLAEARNL